MTHCSVLRPAVLALLVAVGCAEPSTSPIAAVGAPSPSRALVGGLTPGALERSAAAVADARARILPTLADGEARATLDATLGGLEQALALADPLAVADALLRARAAHDLLAAAAADAPAEVSALGLALNAADALLAPPAAPPAVLP